MGFMSTFITEDAGIKWPQWFREKYADSVGFRLNGIGALHSFGERKTYTTWFTLPEDIQRAIKWTDDR